MTLEHWAFTLSERCYRTILFLYPVEFRVRFHKEMAQLFRDSCRDELRNGEFRNLLRLWGRVLIDLALSISRERGQALLDFRHLPVRASGIIDSLVILTIIIFHLLIAGSGIAMYLASYYETAGGFVVVATAIGALLGGLGVICSLVLARFRRTSYRFINL
jgi:hypothetical protein